jgi:flagella basal body P-ring formation protein FlgA
MTHPRIATKGAARVVSDGDRAFSRRSIARSRALRRAALVFLAACVAGGWVGGGARDARASNAQGAAGDTRAPETRVPPVPETDTAERSAARAQDAPQLGSALSADTLLALAEQCVRARAGALPTGATLVLDPLLRPEAVALGGDSARIEVTLAETRVAPLMTPIVRIHVDGRVARSVPIPFRLSLTGVRVRASRTLVKGEAASAAAFDSVTEEIPIPWDAWVGSAAEIEGLVARRVIAAGEIVRRDLFETPAVVHRGDPIVLELDSPSVRILARGTAREDGRIGERIRVARDGERKPLRATVVGRDRVRVALNQRFY